MVNLTERANRDSAVMTRADVAELLRVSERTVDRYLEDGTLRRADLPGRAVRILTTSVDALLQERAS